MLLADYDNEIITLPSQPTKVIVKLNDKIRCYDKDNKIIDVEVIEIIDELTFKIKHDEHRIHNIDLKSADPSTDPRIYTDNKIFVSGTEVDDFHTISKEYIFTLNVCATQELHRRIISQEEHIKELEEKVQRLLNYISL
jgi:sorbitol-specific phosphotransferase system component IIBC